MQSKWLLPTVVWLFIEVETELLVKFSESSIEQCLYQATTNSVLAVRFIKKQIINVNNIVLNGPI